MKPLARRSIPPKISTLPRQKTEAADYLDLYQLAVEKKRLHQELQTLEQRRHQIHQRLVALEQEMTQLKASVQQHAKTSPIPPEPGNSPQTPSYKEFLLEY